ncbi:uncharacterized protein LOC131022977 [Salvia miltiorrhiza]|uniref:uncharacterized protein LOC131022977 n=1 Tax=Salvia miltiorrhiza TaxID=226208 RepID=UPI0025AD4739|nr:uncharacterized protein LOC131022977 [Salvia miltiorrhiza]
MDLKRDLQMVWKIDNEWQIIPMGKSFYTIKFNTAEDKSLVQKSTSWELPFGTMRLRECVRYFDPYKEISSLCEVWMHIYYLPLEFWTLDVITGIGRAMGSPIKVDGASARGAAGHYARILLEINLSRPLPEALLVDGDERSFHVEFEFEQLPAFCSKCKITGHSIDKCNKIKNKSKDDSRHETAKERSSNKGKEIIPMGTDKATRAPNWKPKSRDQNRTVHAHNLPVITENQFGVLEQDTVEEEHIPPPRGTKSHEQALILTEREVGSEEEEGERLISGPDILQAITVPVMDERDQILQAPYKSNDVEVHDLGGESDGLSDGGKKPTEVDTQIANIEGSITRDINCDNQEKMMGSAIKAQRIMETFRNCEAEA